MSVIARKLKRPLKQLLLAAQPPAPDAAWHVDRHELEAVRIRWPKTLEWRYGWGWVEPLFNGFRSRVRVSVADMPQTLSGTVVIEFHRGNRSYRVAINCSDYPDVVHFRPSDTGLDLEFKMQYRAGGYGEPNIVPGGYVSDSMLVDWYARRWRKERDRERFRWDVYGRFGVQFATEVRSRAIELLKGQGRFRFNGGDQKVDFATFLQEIAQSRVCLDLPGNGPFCFRLVNYFAVGACVVSPPHATTMPVPFIDRHHLVYTKPDLSDLLDLCEQYAHDDAARESIVRNARDYYRRNLYWRSLANYYLRTMLDRLPA